MQTRIKKGAIALAILLVFSLSSRGQTETGSPVPPDDVPQFGTFFSAQNWPPMPYDWAPDLPVYSLGNGRFLVDDSSVNYSDPGAWGGTWPQGSSEGARSMDDSGPPSPPGDGGGGTNSSGGVISTYVFSTNGLWLQIVGISNGIVSLALNNPTNEVYAIWSSTDLLTGWNVETEVRPTNTAVMPFTVQTLDRQNLVMKAEDWTGVTENGNTTPDWWFWEYFGTVDLSDTNLDTCGNELLDDYLYGIDPNIIGFSISVANQYVNTPSVPVQINVAAGIPSFMAVLVDDTNWADANWIPYNSSLVAPVGTMEGWHQIWVGLRGLPPTAQQTWVWYRVKLDLTPPLLVITNPASANVMQPMIEVQGFCPEALASLSYDLSNATGFFSNQQAFVLSQYYDTNTIELTTNVFQAFDVPLTNGDNILTFHAADLAGNLTTTNFTFTLSYAARTNPPVVQLYWPQNGTQISGNTFTVRGLVDDFTTTLQTTIMDTNGDTNTVSAIVERDGKFWVGNLPLAAGSNQLTLTATDAAGNVTTTNITVTGSPAALTMNAVDSSQLWQFTAQVGGTISDPTYSVWVNGVQGTNNGDGTWSATNAPINPGGTAVFQVRAIANSDNGGNGSGGGGTASYANLGNPTSATAIDLETSEDKPDRLYVSQYTMDLSRSENAQDQTVTYFGRIVLTNTEAWTDNYSDNSTWSDQAGGSGGWSNGGGNCTCSVQQNWPASFWPDLANGTQSFSACCNPDMDTNIGALLIPLEHCDVNAPTNFSYGPGWGAFFDEMGEFFDLASGWDDITYTRHAQTTMQFDTGGKSVPGVQSLYLFTASAADMLSTNPIPPKTISIGGLGNLGADGNLYVVVPYSAEPIDVTPRVSGIPWFIFNVNPPLKYPIYITANGADLSKAAPTFCVGQNIDFQLAPLPSYTSDSYGNWTLPGNYVNEPWQEEVSIDGNLVDIGSVNYRVDNALLQGFTTHCWYVDQPGGKVSFGGRLYFSNGQNVGIAA